MSGVEFVETDREIGVPSQTEIPAPAIRTPDYNHFYPRDPQLIAVGLRDANPAQPFPRDIGSFQSELVRRFGPLPRRRLEHNPERKAGIGADREIGVPLRYFDNAFRKGREGLDVAVAGKTGV